MSRYGMRLILLFSSILLFFSISLKSVCQDSESGRSDTIFISYPDTLPLFIKGRHPYHQTLTMKLFMAQALYDGKYKRKDNGKSELYLTCEQALEVIRKMDYLTLGIPKIVYLVGWQYNGHDSKYPAWFEGNESIRRPGDPSAIESLKWLMKEAVKYHTTVSLHINMLDAYEDSPLWTKYINNNIIARNIDSTLRSGEWGYPISYTQEWKTGFTKKRIDTLCSLLPLEKAGTIHIDAFHSWPPIPVKKANGADSINLVQSPLSPFLGFTVKDETEAQRQIFRYWASKGIDVTSEGVDFLRETAFEGYQHMAWWFGGKSEHYIKWPASYYTGGMDRSIWGKLFGTSMHGEEIVKKDPEKLTGFKKDFCLNTAVWYYLNRLQRLYLINGKDYKSAGFSDNVRVFLSDKEYRITRGESVILENNNSFIPALWMGSNTIVTYSLSGYKNRKWILPDDWKEVVTVKMSQVTQLGIKEIGEVAVINGTITLSLKKDDMILIEKGRRKENSQYRQLFVSTSN